MGKKSARPGLDGISPDVTRQKFSAKARRIARKESKLRKKKLVPGKKALVKKAASGGFDLQKELERTKEKREKRRQELREKGLLVEGEDDIPDAPEHPVPPHSWSVSVKKGVLFCSVQLHKIPPQKIVCNPTEDRFHVDTLQHSKKFVLDVPYPDGIKCNPDAIAEITPHGVLKVKLRMTHIPDDVKIRDSEKQESIQKVRSLRFRANLGTETTRKRVEETKSSKPESSAGKKTKKPKTYLTSKEQALKMIESISQQEEPKHEQRKTILDHLQDMKAERKERRIQKKAKKQSMEEQAVKSLVAGKRAKLANTTSTDAPPQPKGGSGKKKPKVTFNV